jgi:hypothetical protein
MVKSKAVHCYESGYIKEAVRSSAYTMMFKLHSYRAPSASRLGDSPEAWLSENSTALQLVSKPVNLPPFPHQVGRAACTVSLILRVGQIRIQCCAHTASFKNGTVNNGGLNDVTVTKL